MDRGATGLAQLQDQETDAALQYIQVCSWMFLPRAPSIPIEDDEHKMNHNPDEHDLHNIFQWVIFVSRNE